MNIIQARILENAQRSARTDNRQRDPVPLHSVGRRKWGRGRPNEIRVHSLNDVRVVAPNRAIRMRPVGAPTGSGFRFVFNSLQSSLPNRLPSFQ